MIFSNHYIENKNTSCFSLQTLEKCLVFFSIHYIENKNTLNALTTYRKRSDEFLFNSLHRE